ncbi:hypothetical protein JIN85_06435 [Luteolibacter pohnpeiensis]|uniref:Uncharacterized protein n=1 Tax=Luteolibacter pohnpeiensis TaxID=454153 RepID=A0A934S6F3_9BACT|nr:hypothetical protein [Luteolibacter pohnpeiensis]MBK1882044.1 hypothetical protein [Luteolibacter pohnpeiensis]
MNLFRALLIALPALSTSLPAVEIVSWKAPVDDLVPEPFHAPGVIRLPYPPEECVFFQPGDELWDIRPLFADSEMNKQLQIEWIIWDARSGRVTAKGEMSDLWKIHQRLRGQDQPSHIRLTLSLYEVPPDQSRPVISSKPAATVSWLTDSDEFEVEAADPFYLLGATGTALLDDTNTVTSVKISTRSWLGDQQPMTVDTAFDLETGGSRWFARDLLDGKGMDLVLSSKAELIDGTPTDQITLVQHGNDAVSVSDEFKSTRFQLPDGRWVHALPFPLDVFANLIETKPAGKGMDDPFAATSDGASEWRPVGDFLKKQFPKLASIAPPDDLRATIPYDLLDFRPWLQQHTPSAIEESSFIAYDPLGERVIAISNDQNDGLDEFDRYFSTLDDPETPHILVTLTGNGKTQLVGISGLTASISRTSKLGQEPERLMEISPTFGDANPANPGLTELGLNYRSGPSDNRPSFSIKSKLQLEPGQPLEIMGSSGSDGSGSGIRLECEMLDTDTH